MRLSTAVFHVVGLFLCAPTFAGMSFVQLTDPHLFGDEPENVAALQAAVVEINAHADAGLNYQFGVITGDLGVEDLVSDRAAKKGEPRKLKGNAAEEVKRGAGELAGILSASKVKTWLFVPGNNDLIDEDPESLTQYNGFIVELTAKLHDAGIEVKNLCPKPNDATSGIFETGGLRFIGLNNASFKSNNLAANRARWHDSQLNDVSAVGARIAGGKPVYVFYHIPEVDDPYFVFDAPKGDVDKWIGDRGVKGTPYEYSAWTVQDDVRNAWNAVIAKPDVKGLFAGHFHDWRRGTYRDLGWQHTTAYSTDTRAKLHVCPPIAIKRQKGRTDRAQGFCDVSIGDDGAVRPHIWWYTAEGFGDDFQTAPAPAIDFTVTQPEPIVVDPARGTASGTLELFIPAAAAAAEKRPAPILLRVGNFLHDATHRPLSTRTILSQPGVDAAGKAGDDVLTVRPDPSGVTRVRAEISGLTEAGTSTAKVYDGQRVVGTITATRTQVPFAVHLGGGTEAATLDFMDGKLPWVTLVNGDPLSYQVRWTLKLDGKPTSGIVLLPASGTLPLEVAVDESNVPSFFESAFRTRTRDGTLLLEWAPEPAGTVLASKSIPVHARLSSLSPTWQAVLSTIALMAALCLGAFISVFVTHIVPVSMRRRELKDGIARLARDGKTTLNKSSNSALRTAIRVELRRTREVLDSHWWYSVDILSVLSNAANSIVILGAQIELLSEIDEVRESLAPCDRALYYWMRQIERLLQDAAKKLGTPGLTEQQLGEIRTIVQDARRMKQNVALVNDALKSLLADRVQALRAEIAAMPDDLKGKVADLPELALFARQTETAPADCDYVRFESRVERLDLLIQFLRAYFARQTERGDMDQAWTKLAKLLTRDGPDAQRTAGLLVCQVREGVYAERLLNVLNANPPRARIVVTPRFPIQYESALYSVVFDDRTLNTCAAREALVCRWEFDQDSEEEKRKKKADVQDDDAGKPGQPKYFDDGWSVPKFFKRSGNFEVSASFFDPLDDTSTSDDRPTLDDRSRLNYTSTPVRLPEPAVVEVLKRYRFPIWRSTIEAGRSFLLIILALAGLLAGARDQLTKLDLIPAILAVLAIGYGASGVRNLFTAEAPGPRPAPARPGGLPPTTPPTVPPPMFPPPVPPKGPAGGEAKV